MKSTTFPESHKSTISDEPWIGESSFNDEPVSKRKYVTTINDRVQPVAVAVDHSFSAQMERFWATQQTDPSYGQGYVPDFNGNYNGNEMEENN